MDYSMVIYIICLIYHVCERLFELWLAKRNSKLAFANGAVEVGRQHYLYMVILHVLFTLSCVAEVGYLHRPFSAGLGYSALIGFICAQFLRYWAVSTLGVRWNTRIIIYPKELPMSHGPYRFIRHPNYVAVVLELASLPLIHGAWMSSLVFTVLNWVMLWVRIRAEENALGESYENLFRDKPRFIPKYLNNLNRVSLG